MRAHVYREQDGQLQWLSDPLSCSPCLESQVIHRSTVNSEGQRWKAQQESRGASAEVERRPESRVRLSGTGSKMDRDGPSKEYVSKKTLTSSNIVLLADPTPCTEYLLSEALARQRGFCWDPPLPSR